MKKALKTTFHFMLVCAAALILTVCGGDDDAATGDDNSGNTGTLSNLPGNITITPTVTAATANGDRVAVGTELIATFSGNNNVALNYQWKLDGMNVGTNSETFIAEEPGKYTVTISREGYRPKISPEVAVHYWNTAAPIITSIYSADPSAHIWIDYNVNSGESPRLFLYPSQDVSPANGCDLMDRYHVFSTNNMIDWIDHGEFLRRDNLEEDYWGAHWPRSYFMWAPDATYRTGITDGEGNPIGPYFYYFPHAIGVSGSDESLASSGWRPQPAPANTSWGNDNWYLGVVWSDTPLMTLFNTPTTDPANKGVLGVTKAPKILNPDGLPLHLKPRGTANITTTYAGTIDEILVEAGDYVQVGQVILTVKDASETIQDVKSNRAGHISSISKEVGDTVTASATVAVIATNMRDGRLIDPCIFVDDGKYYMVTGGMNSDLHVAELQDDMITLKTEFHTTSGGGLTAPLPYYHEGPWMFTRKNDYGQKIYYIMYPGTPSDSPKVTPGASMLYSWNTEGPYGVGGRPAQDGLPQVNGTWTYGGVILDPTGTGDTSHGSIVEFNGKSYMFYHNDALRYAKKAPASGALRSVCVDEVVFNANGTIRKMKQSTTSVGQNGPDFDEAEHTRLFGTRGVNWQLEEKYVYAPPAPPPPPPNVNDYDLVSRYYPTEPVTSDTAAPGVTLGPVGAAPTIQIEAGDWVVGHFGGGKWLQFALVDGGTTGGSRLLEIEYATQNAGSAQVTINDGVTYNIECPSSGSWTKEPNGYKKAYDVVGLQPGNNTLRIVGGDVNIRSIAIFILRED